MATCNVLETEITNPDYINFLKVGHALSQFQKGIRPFITRELQAIHETILANIGGQYCGTCTTDNILLHPKRKCRKSGCVCWDDPQYSRRPCPTGYCKQFYDELVQRNRYGTPQMKNVDISKMSRDYWQIAKCFLSPLYSSTITSAYDCDATALCSIIINCKQFEYILGIVVNLTGGQPQDVFSQVKGIKNETRHSAVLEVAGQDMNTKLDTIVLALQCGPLTQDADAKRAANEIMKMKNSTFKVSRHIEKDVIEGKLKTIEETIGAKMKQMAENIVDHKQKATDTFLANQQRDIDKLRETKVKLQDRLAVVETGVVNLKQQVGEMKHEADDQRDKLHKVSEENEIMGAYLLKIEGTIERVKKSLAFKDILKRKIDKHVSSIGKQFELRVKPGDVPDWQTTCPEEHRLRRDSNVSMSSVFEKRMRNTRIALWGGKITDLNVDAVVFTDLELVREERDRSYNYEVHDYRERQSRRSRRSWTSAVITIK